MEPTLTRQVGQFRGGNTVWEKALWALDATNNGNLEWDSLENGLRALLTIFSPHQEMLMKYRQDHEVYFYCGQFSAGRGGGPRVSAELLKLLGDFGVSVHLQTYFSDDES